MSEAKYTEEDLRNAFREGWKERNRDPGLKRQSVHNLISALGGRSESKYVEEKKTYHVSIWLNSAFRKSIT